jgi:hypothetical protein
MMSSAHCCCIDGHLFRPGRGGADMYGLAQIMPFAAWGGMKMFVMYAKAPVSGCKMVELACNA